MLNWTSAFDVLVLAQHVFGAVHKIPDVIESGVRVRWVPLRVSDDGTGVC